MWFDGQRQPNTIYVANISRGKDSTAMLRAIQLLNFPIDMIVSVDIWATKDIPGELPPMVAFKDRYDRMVLEKFGVPVTRLCATKRERERELTSTTESVTHGCATKICSTESQNEGNGLGKLKDSQKQSALGVNTSRSTMLTYEDIFYRTITPRHQRERELQRQKDRLRPNLRIPPSQRDMVSVESQKVSTFGFPSQMCRWCTGELKRIGRRNLMGEMVLKSGVLDSKQALFSHAPI